MSSRFLGLENLLEGRYETDTAIRAQASGIAFELLRICDSLGSSLEDSLYSPTLDMDFLKNGIRVLEEYAETGSCSEEVKRFVGRVHLNAKKLCELVSEVQLFLEDKSKITKRELLEPMLKVYLELSNYSGMNEISELKLKDAFRKVEKSTFKKVALEGYALDSVVVEAPMSIGRCIEKVAYFLEECAAPNSKIVFSAERKGKLTEVEGWCSRVSDEKKIRELVEESWYLNSAAEIIRAYGSELKISPPDRKYLSIKLWLPEMIKGGR
ncbi:MAG: hypothetical protein QXW00_01110 [Candidatus Woesearchaeota archaeon]